MCRVVVESVVRLVNGAHLVVVAVVLVVVGVAVVVVVVVVAVEAY